MWDILESFFTVIDPIKEKVAFLKRNIRYSFLYKNYVQVRWNHFLKPLKVLANVWKPTLKKKRYQSFWNIQVFGNILMVIAVSLPFLYLKIFGETPKTGFYCDDESIGYPYKASTVPLWSLLLGLSVPLITIILVEIVFLPLLHRKSI